MKQSQKTADGTRPQQLSLWAGSLNLVSHFQQQESEKEQRTNATCGQRCLEQYKKFNRPGLLAKMFPALLIGQEGWYSSRCKLTWKLRGTKLFRLFFQLVPSMPPTEETGFGLLPTPICMDTNCGDLEKIDQRRAKAKAKGINGNGFGMTIGEMANRGLLPTPMAADRKGGKTNRTGNSQLTETLGISSQLNPRFVAEMMGFPPDWTELPFQIGETNQSKPTETQ